MARRRAAAWIALAAAAWSPGLARADFLGLEWEDDPFALDGTTLLADLGITNVRVINVYAAFDEAADQVPVILGFFEHPFVVFTSDGSGFLNAPFGTDRPPAEDAAEFFVDLNADSFYTIGNRFINVGPGWSNGDPFTDLVIALPGTSGPGADPWAGPQYGWVARPSQPPPSGGPSEPTPQTVAGNWPGLRVLLMRLVVNEGVDIAGTFHTIVGQVDEQLVVVPVSFSTIDHPSCPGEGDCQDPHATPGCADAGCCNMVCVQDPSCCEQAWDGACADAAAALCVPSGACCHGDGSCEQTSELGCDINNGSYQGDGTDCGPATCPSFQGACCLVGGFCFQSTEMGCAQASGAFQGVGVPCGPGLCPGIGACCLPDRSCLLVTLDGCARVSGDYQGDGTACFPSPCQALLGACCLTDGTCAVLDPAMCEDLGGDFQGDATPCTVGLCLGACCLADDSCVIAHPAECAFMGGTYQGNGIPCGTCPFEVCGGPDTGDCCVGGTVPGCDDEECCITVCTIDPFCCEVRWDGICADEAMVLCKTCGVKGDDTGACCFDNGACGVLSELDCVLGGGTFQGKGATVCFPGLCQAPSGACCRPDGTCLQQTQAQCNGIGGNWQGPFVPCIPGLCVPVKGACCFDDGSCAALTAALCAAQGGAYQGDDTVCLPGLCAGDPARQGSPPPSTRAGAAAPQASSQP